MALIPPHYLNAVVSIGVLKKDQNDQVNFSSIATGFLVGKETGEENESGPLYKLFLVTNRHVFYNKSKDTYLEQVTFRFNTIEDKSHHFIVPLMNADKPIWYQHDDEDVDLAVLPISANAIKEKGVNFHFFTPNEIFDANKFSEKNIATGDDLYVLGFPMSISGKSRNFVIVRQGIIARVDEEILEEGFYYIDASAYPGNSGGPVIVKPEMVSINGTSSNNSAGLIGVISSGETYKDIAYSQQTGEAKIIFTEQTGLVRVVPTERIYEIIDQVMKEKVPDADVKSAGDEVDEEVDGSETDD